eukprot:6934663-Ditylum_brightwellii.AAC.1
MASTISRSRHSSIKGLRRGSIVKDWSRNDGVNNQMASTIQQPAKVTESTISRCGSINNQQRQQSQQLDGVINQQRQQSQQSDSINNQQRQWQWHASTIRIDMVQE